MTHPTPAAQAFLLTRITTRTYRFAVMSQLPAQYSADSSLGASLVHKAEGAFSLETDVADAHTLHLVMGWNGTRTLWTRHFGDLIDRDAVLDRFGTGTPDLIFMGRVTAIFGPATIDLAVDDIVNAAREARSEQAETEARRRRDRHIIHLYAPDTKRGYKLQLQRKGESYAEWSVRYDRAIERDRLCDWVRWQKPRFAEFLELAEKHGSEALTRLLTDEMFETERRIKKEGRGAGGMRPLRMWRGDS